MVLLRALDHSTRTGKAFTTARGRRWLRLTIGRVMLKIKTHEHRADHCRDRVAGAGPCRTRHQAAERKRPFGCESQARCCQCEQSVVSAVAAVRHLLPARAS